MRLSVVETGWFVLSVAVFAFLYGVAVGAWKWPPYAWIARPTGQAEAAYRAVQGNPLRSEIHGTHLRPNSDLLVTLHAPSLMFVVDPTSLM